MTRLLLASRLTVAVALTVAALQLVAGVLHIAQPLALMGAIVAMQASLAVNDAKARTTMLLVPLPGALGAVLGALFASRGLVAEFVFLGVLFGAVAIRVRGPRWTAFGTIATVTYFLALFLDATLAQLPALGAAIVAGAGFSYVSRFVLLRDRPAWIARHTVAALKARIRLVATVAQTLVEADDYASRGRQLEVAVQRLNQSAATIEEHLGFDASDEQRIVFDAALAAEDLAASALRLRVSETPAPRALRLSLLALARGRSARAARIAARVPHERTATEETRALATAIVAVHETIGEVEAASAALGLSDAPWKTVAGLQPPPAIPQAIQVTVAAAASMVVSALLGSPRWYWSVLAAYFVFVGTSSSGETRARAWSRIVGTALGVTAGLLVGLFAPGHSLVTGAAIFACLFLGAYALRMSYSTAIFFITAMLALLYSQLGRFSYALLEMRLAETAIGALFGGLAATLILPTRARDLARAKASETLAAADDVVRTSIARLLDPNTDADPFAAARVLEERVQEFIARAKPVDSSPLLHGAGRDAQRWIVPLSACAYYARTLARVADRSNGVQPCGALVPLWRIDESLSANMHAAAERINDRVVPTTDTAILFEDVRRAIARDGGANEPLRTAAHLLERLDRTVARLARDGASPSDATTAVRSPEPR